MDFSASPTTDLKDSSTISQTFTQAFAEARFRLGPGRTFIWNGQEFTTFYSEELFKSGFKTVDEKSLVNADSIGSKKEQRLINTEE